VLHRLADLGNTVIIIEHNLDVIRSADWILDLGPEGGEGGGSLVAKGTPTDVAATLGSYTGEFLRRYFPPRELKPLKALATNGNHAPRRRAAK
jgi:excinuclease ABC subunit A